MLFFAFAGYARIATLGEEVRDPARTIPRAIPLALRGIVLVVYLAGWRSSAWRCWGLRPWQESSTAPLAEGVAGGGLNAPVVRAGAVVAVFGVLLSLLAGVARTALAMGRRGDLPAPLAAVHPRFGVPHVAEIAVAVAIVVLVLVADLRGAIGFSSFGVLVYYLVANASALTQPPAERRVPRWLSAAGAIGCLVLVATLPVEAVLAGLAVFAVGAVYRSVRRLIARRRAAG